jgi:hypothetical protein
MGAVMKPKPFIVQVRWADLLLDAEGFYTPGDPGRLSGPPEKCYPPEPSEIEITKLSCEEKDAMFLIGSDHGEDICDTVLETLEFDQFGEPDYEEPEVRDPFDYMEEDR